MHKGKMTVTDVSRLSGVSVRALRYYDRLGLLRPVEYTETGYRLYDEAAIEKLQQILLFRELEFPLKDIKSIMDCPDFDRCAALKQQIELLTLKKQHLEELIELAERIRKGENDMDFKPFDTGKIDEYAAKAKAMWGGTGEYAEFEERSKKRTADDERNLAAGLMALFSEFGSMKDQSPDSDAVLAQVGRLQSYISEHYYRCSNEILISLGEMYACGGEFTENIDAAGGSGTADFVYRAIKAYCSR